MKLCYCDACKVNIPNGRTPNVLEVPCHLYSLYGKEGYSDSEGNTVSGRRDTIDLCNSCLNLAWGWAIKALVTKGLVVPPNEAPPKPPHVFFDSTG